MWEILVWIVFGLVAGAIAKLLMPGKDPGGLIVTILLGIVGALVGGFLGRQLGFGGLSGFDLRSLGLCRWRGHVVAVGVSIASEETNAMTSVLTPPDPVEDLAELLERLGDIPQKLDRHG